MNTNLLKTKTFWASISAIIASIAGYLTGEIETGQAIQTGITAILTIFLRDGIITNSK